MRKNLNIAIFLLQLFQVTAVINYTISGFSSGGFMASQVHVSYSSSVTGAGIVAGGPYYCSQGSFTIANTICSHNDSTIDINPLTAYAFSMSSKGLIDPISSMKSSKVFIFTGLIDELILPATVKATYDFYKTFIPAHQITFVNNLLSNHAWPSKSQGNPCWYRGRYSINNCGFDGSGILLTTLLGPLYQDGQSDSNNLFTFPQAKYADLNQATLDVSGFVYVPKNCQLEPEGCRVHLHLHGCGQNFQTVGLNYIQLLGIQSWAEGNDIIVIFPQTKNASVNFGGCWDFSGYTGSNFAVKTGIQVKAVHGMAQDYANIVRNLFK